MIEDDPGRGTAPHPAPVNDETASVEVCFALLVALGAAGGRHPADWSRDTPEALLGDVGPSGWQVRLQAAARMLEDAGYRCTVVSFDTAESLFTRPLSQSVATILAKLCQRRARITGPPH